LIAAQDSATARKWCVFTRTCGELLRLHTNKGIKKFLLQGLLDETSEAGGDEKAEQDIQLMFLHTITSTKKCEAQVKAFAGVDERRNSESKKEELRPGRVLLCIADMRECSANQVNVLRTAIDEYVSAKQLAVVILHFPPELSVASESCYHAIYLKEWDFTYIDSFGIETNSETSAEQGGNGQRTENHSREVDAREWIAKVRIDILFFHLSHSYTL